MRAHTDTFVQQLHALCSMLIAEAWAEAWPDISLGYAMKVVVRTVSGLA